MKDVLVIILAVVCVGLSLVCQPWAEMGFGVDKNELPTAENSLLAEPLHALANAYASSPLKDFADNCQKHITGELNEEAHENGLKPDPDWNKAVLSGDYAYVLVMGLAMTAAAIAIILIGREESEEKLVLPAKK